MATVMLAIFGVIIALEVVWLVAVVLYLFSDSW